MSGNIWEWTRSLYEKDYPVTEDLWQKRNVRGQKGRYVLRGGAFDGSQDYARCSARNLSEADLRGDDIGFRVALSPLL